MSFILASDLCQTDKVGYMWTWCFGVWHLYRFVYVFMSILVLSSRQQPNQNETNVRDGPWQRDWGKRTIKAKKGVKIVEGKRSNFFNVNAIHCNYGGVLLFLALPNFFFHFYEGHLTCLTAHKQKVSLCVFYFSFAFMLILLIWWNVGHTLIFQFTIFQ